MLGLCMLHLDNEEKKCVCRIDQTPIVKKKKIFHRLCRCQDVHLGPDEKTILGFPQQGPLGIRRFAVDSHVESDDR